MNYVYRYMNGNEWVYVGKASAEKVRDELQNRIRSHSKDARFAKYENAKIEYCMFEHKSDMDITETMLIKLHNPVINRVGVTNTKLPFKYDDSSIIWFDIKDFTRHRRSLEEEIQHEKLKEMIKTRSVMASKETIWFSGEHHLVTTDKHVEKFARYMYDCANKWFLNNKEDNYPECMFEFDISLDDLMFELDYQTRLSASSFSRKLKETIKEVFPREGEYWVSVKHDKTNFTISVTHTSALWRDVAHTVLKLGGF